MSDDDLTLLRCFICGGSGRDREGDECRRCEESGKVFWAGGYSFPYTPEGEKRAKRLASLIKAGTA